MPDGKEQLLLAVAEFEAERVLGSQEPYLRALHTWAHGQAWRDTVVAHYKEQGRHCALNVVMSQIGRNTPGAQFVPTRLMERLARPPRTRARRGARQPPRERAPRAVNPRKRDEPAHRRKAVSRLSATRSTGS